MKITELEHRLKEIDQKFEIVQHPNNPELAGIYYDRNLENKTGFLVTVPSQEIYETFNQNYQDSTGHPHNAADKILFLAQDHLNRLANEPGYKENFYSPIDFGSSPVAR